MCFHELILKYLPQYEDHTLSLITHLRAHETLRYLVCRLLLEKQFRKQIMKIKTNSLEPGEAKDPEGNTLFEIYQAFATESQVADVRQRYADGIAWGDMKQFLFEHLNEMLQEPREKYLELMEQPKLVGEVLQQGATRARALSQPFVAELYDAVGIKPMWHPV